jgi:predicted component of type VI protein secretion system
MRTTVWMCVALSVLLASCDKKEAPPQQEQKDLSMKALTDKKLAKDIRETQEKIDGLLSQLEMATNESQRADIRQQIEDERKRLLEMSDRAASGR